MNPLNMTTEQLIAEVLNLRSQQRQEGVAEKLAKLARHADDCLSSQTLPTGEGYWHCTCGLDSLVLDGELIATPTPAPSATRAGELVALYEAASKGFHISETCGPDKKYWHIIKFPSMADLHAYEDAWRTAMLSAKGGER